MSIYSDYEKEKDKLKIIIINALKKFEEDTGTMLTGVQIPIFCHYRFGELDRNSITDILVKTNIGDVAVKYQ